MILRKIAQLFKIHYEESLLMEFNGSHAFSPLYAISRRQAQRFCLLLSGFELLIYLGSDMMMPAMLAVTRDMQATIHHVPAALNAYLVGGIAFQWLLGPLSDRYGRRPVLLAGAFVYALACIGAACSRQIEWFNALRFIQGTGLGFIMVVGYPSLQELFRESDAIRLMALLGSIALLSPLIGPLLGGLLLQWLPWRALCAGLGLLALPVAVGLWRCMPETVGVARRDGSSIAPVPLDISRVLTNYVALLREHRFVCGAVALGLATAPIIGWIGLSPVLLMHARGFSPLAYSLAQLPIFGGVIAGALLLNRLPSRYNIRQILRVSLLTAAVGWLSTVLSSFVSDSPALLIISLTLYALGLGLGNTTLYRLTLFATASAKGSAAAMLGMISTAVLSAALALLTQWNADTSVTRFAVGASLTPALATVPLWLLMRTASSKQQPA